MGGGEGGGPEVKYSWSSSWTQSHAQSPVIAGVHWSHDGSRWVSVSPLNLNAFQICSRCDGLTCCCRNYDFASDGRWNSYRAGIEIPIGRDEEPILQKYRAKWYQREVVNCVVTVKWQIVYRSVRRLSCRTPTLTHLRSLRRPISQHSKKPVVCLSVLWPSCKHCCTAPNMPHPCNLLPQSTHVLTWCDRLLLLSGRCWYKLSAAKPSTSSINICSRGRKQINLQRFCPHCSACSISSQRHQKQSLSFFKQAEQTEPSVNPDSFVWPACYADPAGAAASAALQQKSQPNGLDVFSSDFIGLAWLQGEGVRRLRTSLQAVVIKSACSKHASSTTSAL